MQNDKAFVGAIPEVYDRLLVPLIFQPYADDLASRIAALGPRRLLETAAGTGVLTRTLLQVLAASVRITATDLNPAMLERAGAHTTDSRVSWQRLDAQTLPFADGSFDVVCCQFGAMFFPDKVRAYREAGRVLCAGGSFLFSVWDDLAANDFTKVVTDALAAVFPQDPPLFMARTPHGHHDQSRIRADLIAAGFSDILIDTVAARSVAASAREAATALCQGTPLRGEIEARGSLQHATDRATDALTARFGAGSIEGGIRALVVTARKPA